MGLLQNRKVAFKYIEKLTEDPSKVLVIHYSQSKPNDDDYADISPLISSIVIKSLGEFETHFSIYYEADKAHIPLDEIENSYRELELRVLRSFNEFVKKNKHCFWVHWDMKNIHFGFDAIKHRYEKVFEGLKEEKDFEEIPENKKFNLRTILEDIYGEKFASKPDKLASLITLNNGNIPNNDYLNLNQEQSEFERKNYQAILKSVGCKVDFICKALKLLKNKKLRLANKNRYAIFVDIVTHPIFTFIGWLATILGLIAGLYAIIG